MIITLSESGKEIINEMEALLVEFITAIIDGMNIEDTRMLEQLVSNVAKNVLNHLKDGDDVCDQSH